MVRKRIHRVPQVKKESQHQVTHHNHQRIGKILAEAGLVVKAAMGQQRIAPGRQLCRLRLLGACGFRSAVLDGSAAVRMHQLIQAASVQRRQGHEIVQIRGGFPRFP